MELENYQSENTPQTVSLEDFIKLRDYCKQLENALKEQSIKRRMYGNS